MLQPGIAPVIAMCTSQAQCIAWDTAPGIAQGIALGVAPGIAPGIAWGIALLALCGSVHLRQLQSLRAPGGSLP